MCGPLPPAEGAIAEILAPGLWALQTRSCAPARLHQWEELGLAMQSSSRQRPVRMFCRQDQIDKPSIAYWRDHSAGASRRRVTPMPRGSRPSTAAFTSSGARKASEIVILTCRMLHFSRAAICSTPVTVPAMISSSQRRPRAIEATSVTRVSARIGRRSPEDTDSRHDDLASPFHRRLLPWDAQNKSLIVHRVGRIARCLCLELDCQLIRLHLDADDVATDEVTVIAVCAIREMLADGASDASLDLGRRHPANRTGTPRLPMQEG